MLSRQKYKPYEGSVECFRFLLRTSIFTKGVDIEEHVRYERDKRVKISGNKNLDDKSFHIMVCIINKMFERQKRKTSVSFAKLFTFAGIKGCEHYDKRIHNKYKESIEALKSIKINFKGDDIKVFNIIKWDEKTKKYLFEVSYEFTEFSKVCDTKFININKYYNLCSNSRAVWRYFEGNMFDRNERFSIKKSVILKLLDIKTDREDKIINRKVKEIISKMDMVVSVNGKKVKGMYTFTAVFKTKKPKKLLKRETHYKHEKVTNISKRVSKDLVVKKSGEEFVDFLKQDFSF